MPQAIRSAQPGGGVAVSNLKPKFCFVISPIGEPESTDRRRSDGILDEVIKPGMGPPDRYHVERADHDKSPGIVTESIIGKLLDADLVVADLTGVNPNVMYELALRHATGKPVVQIMEMKDIPCPPGAQEGAHHPGLRAWEARRVGSRA